jgi:hypothetical protein
VVASAAQTKTASRLVHKEDKGFSLHKDPEVIMVVEIRVGSKLIWRATVHNSLL